MIEHHGNIPAPNKNTPAQKTQTRRTGHCGTWTFLSIAALAIGACDNRVVLGPLEDDSSRPVPTISALSTLELSVGDALTFVGNGFSSGEHDWVVVHFSGLFIPEDGSKPNPIELEVPLRTASLAPGLLTWERFGEYRVPFLPSGNKLGVFLGKVFAENVVAQKPVASTSTKIVDRVMQTKEPIVVSIRVLPSLVVLDNRAFSDSFVANCVEPSTVVFGVLPYALRIKALGFSPSRYDFEASAGLLQADTDNKRWVVAEESQAHGFLAPDGGEFAVAHRWAPVPRFHPGYRSSISVSASDGTVSRRVHFPMVVRPVMLPALGPGQIAETFTPQAQSGCIPGHGHKVEYQEKSSETRTRTVLHRFVDDIGDRMRAVKIYPEGEPDSLSAQQPVKLAVLSQFDRAAPTDSDLFSDAPERGFASDMGWRQPGPGEEPSSAFLEQLQDVLSPPDFEPMPGAWTNWSDRSTWELRDFVGQRDLSEVLASPWPARDHPVAETWGYPRSYQRQIGWPFAESHAALETFPEALLVAEHLESRVPDGATVSSEDLATGDEAIVWEGMEGMWYRQTVRLRYPASYVVHDLCGSGAVVGESVLTDWTWGHDLGTGKTCPPPSNFPSAGCLIAPCAEL